MPDNAVPDLDMTVGYFILREGKTVWEVYQGDPATFRLALKDMLGNKTILAIYFLVSGTIWMRLPI
jgi:hypothetical protein